MSLMEDVLACCKCADNIIWLKRYERLVENPPEVFVASAFALQNRTKVKFSKISNFLCDKSFLVETKRMEKGWIAYVIDSKLFAEYCEGLNLYDGSDESKLVLAINTVYIREFCKNTYDRYYDWKKLGELAEQYKQTPHDLLMHVQDMRSHNVDLWEVPQVFGFVNQNQN